MIKNQANIYQFVLRDMIGQGVTGLSPTVRIRKDTGSFAATTNTPTEVGNGLYEVALTATECNCDIMAIEVSLPDGQFPAILTNEYLTTTGGATPAEIWGYTGGRTVDNTIPTVNDIWGRQSGDTTSRTITNTIPSASDNATAVWGAAQKIVTIDSTQAATLAAASDLDSVATKVELIKSKTDNLPQSPAAVGSEMALTSAAISAVQNGLSTFNASTDTVTLNATEDGTLTAIKTKVDTLTNTDLTGIATSTDVSNAQTAIIARGNEAWITATGFTVPGDLLGLATTEGLVNNLNLLTQHGNTYWITATGFATPSDIPSAENIWEYPTRTITDSPDIQAELTTYGAAKTSDIPTSQDIWEYPDRELTSEISVDISAQNIADITESVWEAPDRTLTDMKPKPNQKNIVCTPSNVINSYGIPRLENWTNETAGTQAFDDKINTYITLAKEKMATDLNDQINAAIAYIGADNITELCAWLTGYNLYQDDKSTDTDSLPETRYNQYLEQIHRIMENI